MREFTVQLSGVTTFEGFVSAFNEGFCKHFGGFWHGRSWDAFHDYLSWPEENSFILSFVGWESCTGLSAEDRKTLNEIFESNPHAHINLA